MKKIFAIAVATLIAGTLFAQKGSILVYGNASMTSSKDDAKNKTTVSQRMPGIGYQFNKNWTAGLAFDLMNSKSKTDAGTEFAKKSNFSVGPFVRYTKNLSSTFSVFGQLDAMFGTSKSGVAVETKTNTMNLGVTPAVSVHVTKKMAMNFSFGGLSYATSKVDLAGANTESDLNLTFGKTTNIGVQLVF
jgi:hypothetical protein